MPLSTAQRNQLFHQAMAARGIKNAALAHSLLHKLTVEAPDFAPAYTELGILFAETGQPEQAANYLQRAVQLAPSDMNCQRTLGYFYRNHRDWGNALSCFEKAAKLAPANVPALKDLLSTQRALHDHAAALQTTGRILSITPKDMGAAIMRGEALDSLGQTSEASALFEAWIDHPDLPLVAIQRWADIMMRLERVEELVGWLDGRLKNDCANVALLLLVSSACVRLGRYQQAIAALTEARQLAPENPHVLHDLGVLHLHMGSADKASQCFDRILQNNSFDAEALRLFGLGHKYHKADAPFERLIAAGKHMQEYPLAGQTQLSYALGKAYDDVGEHALAFEYFTSAGRAHLIDNPLAEDKLSGYIQLARSTFSRDFFNTPPEPGFESKMPVFVLGMPRSGTSLVEQVLSSHPEVYGAGELTDLGRAVSGMRINGSDLLLASPFPFFGPGSDAGYRDRGARYLDMISAKAPPEAKKIVDKMPGNYVWVGSIRLILPGAKIIHCRRHPVETCLSAFRIFFAVGNNASSDLREMGKSYRRYEELMCVWRDSLPTASLLEVRYEDMVFDFENQAHRLIDFVGLEWNDACLNFYQNERAVQTASAAQVRKPVYTTSTNRWRKYEAFIKPLLEELGPLVQEYEDELNSKC